MTVEMNNWAALNLQKAIFQGTSFTALSEIWVALLLTAASNSDTGTSISNNTGTGVEVSGGNYARQGLSCTSSNWSNTNGAVANLNAITWPAATWTGTVVAIALCDQQTGGDIVYQAPLSANKTIAAGDVFQFAVGELTCNINT